MPAPPPAPADRRDPHCLVVTKLLPLPADGGGKQRTLALLERLARTRPVTVVAFDEGGADHRGLADLGIEVRAVPWERRPIDLAAGLVRSASLTTARFWSARLAALARTVGEEHPDGTLVVEFPQLEPLVRGVPARRVVFATQNIESALVESYAATATGPKALALRAEAAAVRRLERRLIRRADVVGVVSGPDRGRLGAVGTEVVVCPNGWTTGEVLPPADEPVAVFVAHMGWSPNVDAATWLGREVWPLVRAAEPDARLVLVGRTPSPEVRALAGPGVEVTGTVPDVRPHLARARVGLAPLRAGGGTRLKILEALGAGRPVVATTVGAEGLDDLVGRGVVLADEPKAMADAILELLGAPDQATALGRVGHDAVSARYSWDATLAPLLHACD